LASLTGILVPAVDAQTEDPVLIRRVRGTEDRAVPLVHGDIVGVLRPSQRKQRQRRREQRQILLACAPALVLNHDDVTGQHEARWEV
jgi:hypothetical protein